MKHVIMNKLKIQLETFIDHQKQEIKVKLTRANIITTKKSIEHTKEGKTTQAMQFQVLI
jgi:hypothetical protein